MSNLSDFNNFQKYLNQNILCVDYGTKIIGLASFMPGRDPYPLTAGRIIYQDDQKSIEEIQVVVDDECIDLIVLGLPLHLDGNESDMTKRVREFGTKLEQKLGTTPVLTQDETLSSFEAENRMKNSAEFNFQVDMKKIDEIAACIILEDFIRVDGIK